MRSQAALFRGLKASATSRTFRGWGFETRFAMDHEGLRREDAHKKMRRQIDEARDALTALQQGAAQYAVIGLDTLGAGDFPEFDGIVRFAARVGELQGELSEAVETLDGEDMDGARLLAAISGAGGWESQSAKRQWRRLPVKGAPSKRRPTPWGRPPRAPAPAAAFLGA